jgi:arylsulfatase A-like enzyme
MIRKLLCVISIIVFFIPSEHLNAQGKNVIIISIDDLNDWIQPYNGNSSIKTPSFDRLSDLGCTFSNCWPAVPWCNPSRVSLFTGIHPLRSGITTNGEYPFRNHLRYAKTLIQHFAESGYYTYGAGKIFHKDDALNEKWDEFYSHNTLPIPEILPANNLPDLIEARGESFDWQGIDAPLESWGDYKITLGAVDFMNRWKETEPNDPFLMILGYRFPHLPWYYPDQFSIDLEDQNIEMPDDFVPDHYTFISRSYKIIKESGKWEEAVEGYVSSVNFLDYNIGLFLDTFFKLGYDKNTILIVFSDHGYHLGEKGRWEKVTLWNESLISPLIIYIPEITSANQYVSDPVSLIDIYPTLIESCDLSRNKFVDGRSLIRNILGNNSENSNTIQTSITMRGGAITDKSYKYFYENDFEGFYHYLSDKNELNNLAYSTDHSVQALKNYYSEMLNEAMNDYRQYDVPDIPGQLSVVIDSSHFIISWDKPIDENVFYELMLSEKPNFKERTYLRSDTNMFILEKQFNKSTYFKVRSINPKYKSEWSPLFKLNFNLKDILLEDPVISIYDISGKLLYPPTRYSDDPNILQRYSGGYYVFQFVFQEFTLHRKFYIQ